jgi:glycosyltransferase involved in cell wall biosynthesis
MPPLVSVVIPTFNCAHYIQECLQSLVAQRYERFEAIIVDDASTDDTFDLLSGRLPDGRFRIHRQEQNQGASIARNTGVGMASGEYVVFVDADDCLLPDHLETVVRELDQMPDVGLLCCDSRLIGPAGETLHGGKTWHEVQCAIKGRTLATGHRSLNDIFQFSHCFTGFTVRRSVYEAVGGLDQTIFPLDDYDFMLRVAGRGHGVFYIDEALALRRDHDANWSGARYSVKVGQMKLRCLEQAVAANPELRATGRAIPRRFAEVYEELAISCFYQRQWKEAVSKLIRAATLDPRRIGNITKLGLRGVSRRVRRAAAPSTAGAPRTR